MSNSGNAVTLSNAAVIGKTLTGYAPAYSNTVLASDSILQAIEKIAPSTFYGAWSSVVNYALGNQVLYQGNLWQAITPNINSPPVQGVLSSSIYPADSWLDTGYLTSFGGSYEIGVKFSPTVSGFINGGRFMRTSALGQSTYTCTLWDNAGTVLGQKTVNTSSLTYATGMNTILFTSPIAVTASQNYTISFGFPSSNYPYKNVTEPNPPDINLVLNGTYHSTAGTYPALYAGNNEYIDFVFSTNSLWQLMSDASSAPITTATNTSSITANDSITTCISKLNSGMISVEGVNVGSVTRVCTENAGRIGTASITAGTGGISVVPTANTITINNTLNPLTTTLTGYSPNVAEVLRFWATLA